MDVRAVSAPGLRILFVEDHPDTADAMTKLLLAAGHHVRFASNADRAHEEAQRAGGELDLFIFDIGLPDKDGCELLRELRVRYNVPAIALTAHAYPADVRRCLDAGFSAHIAKPIIFDALLEAIARTRNGQIVASADIDDATDSSRCEDP